LGSVQELEQECKPNETGHYFGATPYLNIGLQPTPTAFARTSLRLSARLTAGVSAPSEAWRFLQGVSPC
jgi:hypothetical protein